MKRVGTIRWMSHSYALNTVLEILDALLDILEDIKYSENDRIISADAVGLITYFTSQTSLYTAWNCKQIFNILSPLTTLCKVQI